jgi:O-antigen/teichoic acid export membrane protein
VTQTLMESLRNHIRVLRTSSLAHNAGWMLVGQGLNLLLQAGYFILLARLLGVQEYGIFAGAFAFVSIVTPYCALGSGMLFMRYVTSKSRDVAAYWGNILVSTLSVGTALAVVLYLVAPHLLNPASASIVLPVAIGNCICSQLLGCMGAMFQAFEQLHMTAVLSLLTNFARLLAVAAMAAALRRADARQWAEVSLLVSVLAVITGSAIVTLRFGRPAFVLRLFRSRALEGFGFSFAGSTQSIYNDIDKTMLSHYGMNLQNGIYTMAYRVVDIATMPIVALDSAALPRFFRQSREGFASVATLSIRLAKRAVVLGLMMSVCMFVAAPLIPRIIGQDFAASVLALRWLCLLPAFRAVHQLTGSAITGMGFQRFRTIVQFGAAALNLGLNLWLIPAHGWIGAAWASLVTDGAIAVSNCLVLYRLRISSEDLGT